VAQKGPLIHTFDVQICNDPKFLNVVLHVTPSEGNICMSWQKQQRSKPLWVSVQIYEPLSVRTVPLALTYPRIM